MHDALGSKLPRQKGRRLETCQIEIFVDVSSYLGKFRTWMVCKCISLTQLLLFFLLVKLLLLFLFFKIEFTFRN